jgi:hypothetical protein|tara:strand:- start:4514 stop:4705 length:192 start_codon:yes stop_codon:yes gene_type:complete
MRLSAKAALTASISTAAILILPSLVHLMFAVLPGFLAPIAGFIIPVAMAAGLAWLITYIWTVR